MHRVAEVHSIALLQGFGCGVQSCRTVLLKNANRNISNSRPGKKSWLIVPLVVTGWRLSLIRVQSSNTFPDDSKALPAVLARIAPACCSCLLHVPTMYTAAAQLQVLRNEVWIILPPWYAHALCVLLVPLWCSCAASPIDEVLRA